MIRNVNTDLAAGFLGLLLSLTFWWLIDPEITHLSLVFPMAMIVIMAVVSSVLVIKGFSRGAQRADLFAVGSNRRVAVTGVGFFAWALAIPILGFFVASLAAITLIAWVLARARMQVSITRLAGWILIIAGETAFFYLIFTRLLHIQLPTGWFF